MYHFNANQWITVVRDVVHISRLFIFNSLKARQKIELKYLSFFFKFQLKITICIRMIEYMVGVFTIHKIGERAMLFQSCILFLHCNSNCFKLREILI